MSIQRRKTGVGIPALLALTLIGCGGGSGGSSEAASADEAKAAAPAVVENAATLNIAVNFDGTPPNMATIDMSEEKVCADKHAQPQKTEEVVVNGGKLQNVFVYVKDGLTGTYSTPSETVTVDQNGCIYKPHISGAMVGQNLVFKNSDGILHNVKAVPTGNLGFNISQPVTGNSPVKKFNNREVMIPVECNVHGWMKSYIGILDHPYFGVSGADGATTIANLPPGTYTIEAWHEKFGVQTQTVTVGASETKDVTFSFSAKVATRVPLGEPIVIPHALHADAHAGGW